MNVNFSLTLFKQVTVNFQTYFFKFWWSSNKCLYYCTAIIKRLCITVTVKEMCFFGIKVAYFSFLVLVAYLGSARVIVVILLRRSRYLLPVDVTVYCLKQAAAPPQNSLDSFNFL